MDETHVKVRGSWVYLYRAEDKAEQTVDFFLSRNRDVNAAKTFLRNVSYALQAAQLHEKRSRLKRIFNDLGRFSTLRQRTGAHPPRSRWTPMRRRIAPCGK
jgi:hypothetical protein